MRKYICKICKKESTDNSEICFHVYNHKNGFFNIKNIKRGDIIVFKNYYISNEYLSSYNELYHYDTNDNEQTICPYYIVLNVNDDHLLLYCQILSNTPFIIDIKSITYNMSLRKIEYVNKTLIEEAKKILNENIYT